MYLDVVDLRDFYANQLGLVTRRMLALKLAPYFKDSKGSCIVGLGFATPYLNACRQDAERLLAFMPAAQGVVNWPSKGMNAAALVHAGDLPLPDSSVDKVVFIHGLELADNPADLLREAWRVLAPGGRLVAVVPNRRGLWARIDTTPFGYGRPFSRGQMMRLLRDALFSPSSWSEALYFMPFRSRLFLSSAGFWERMGTMLWPAFGGVLIVEATKQMAQGLAVRQKFASKVMKPVFVPPAAATPKSF
jgi:SAM-dependent methyltransferase